MWYFTEPEVTGLQHTHARWLINRRQLRPISSSIAGEVASPEWELTACMSLTHAQMLSDNSSFLRTYRPPTLPSSFSGTHWEDTGRASEFLQPTPSASEDRDTLSVRTDTNVHMLTLLDEVVLLWDASVINSNFSCGPASLAGSICDGVRLQSVQRFIMRILLKSSLSLV